MIRNLRRGLKDNYKALDISPAMMNRKLSVAESPAKVE